MGQVVSDGSPQTLTSAGVSRPVLIETVGQLAPLSPCMYVMPTPDAVFGAFIEVTFDPIGADNELPSPGNWMPYTGAGGVNGFSGVSTAINGTIPAAARYLELRSCVTAVRLNLGAISAGAVTFGVKQARDPGGFLSSAGQTASEP